jgi:hypothetical protein
MVPRSEPGSPAQKVKKVRFDPHRAHQASPSSGSAPQRLQIVMACVRPRRVLHSHPREASGVSPALLV